VPLAPCELRTPMEARKHSRPAPCASSQAHDTHAFACASPTPLNGCAYAAFTRGLLIFDVFPTPRPHFQAFSRGPQTPRVSHLPV